MVLPFALFWEHCLILILSGGCCRAGYWCYAAGICRIPPLRNLILAACLHLDCCSVAATGWEMFLAAPQVRDPAKVGAIPSVASGLNAFNLLVHLTRRTIAATPEAFVFGSPSPALTYHHARACVCPRQRIEKVLVYNLPLTCRCWPANMQLHAGLRAGFRSGKPNLIGCPRYQLLQVIYLTKNNVGRSGKAPKLDLGRPPLESRFYAAAKAPCPSASHLTILRGWLLPLWFVSLRCSSTVDTDGGA